MKPNPILQEIRKTREDIARETGGDLNKLFEYVLAEEAKARARGVKFAPLPEPVEPSASVREEPPEA
ncbi:MAG: hypothetical protein ABMA13_12655 [Chthoniobacteraceae bacterium]